MMKLTLVIWLLVGTVLAGAAVTAVLAIPQLLDQGMILMPIAGVGGYLIGLPISYVIARNLMAEGGRAA